MSGEIESYSVSCPPLHDPCHRPLPSHRPMKWEQGVFSFGVSQHVGGRKLLHMRAITSVYHQWLVHQRHPAAEKSLNLVHRGSGWCAHFPIARPDVPDVGERMVFIRLSLHHILTRHPLLLLILSKLTLDPYYNSPNLRLGLYIEQLGEKLHYEINTKGICGTCYMPYQTCKNNIRHQSHQKTLTR